MDVSNSVKTELCELSNAIEKTKQLAMHSPEGFDYGSKYLGIKEVEYSFEKALSVTNCGEVWSAREAISNGAKFKELSFQSIDASDGSAKELCKNCKNTFQ